MMLKRAEDSRRLGDPLSYSIFCVWSYVIAIHLPAKVPRFSAIPRGQRSHKPWHISKAGCLKINL